MFPALSIEDIHYPNTIWKVCNEAASVIRFGLQYYNWKWRKNEKIHIEDDFCVEKNGKIYHLTVDILSEWNIFS